MIAYRTNYGGAPVLPVIRPRTAPTRRRVTSSIPRGAPKPVAEVTDSLLPIIGAAMVRHGISAAMFGRLAVKDQRLVSDMRQGRSLGPKVRAKVLAFLAELEGRL